MRAPRWRCGDKTCPKHGWQPVDAVGEYDPVDVAFSECQYRSGMTAEELAKTMSPKKASRYWSVMIDRYFERELGRS